MSRFTTPLQIAKVGRKVPILKRFLWGRKRWIICEEFSYFTYLDPLFFIGVAVTRESSEKITIDVPKGTITDFATIPRVFWWVLPPKHKHYGKAAVVHDYLYRFGLHNKEWADEVFIEAMEVLGAPAWKRSIMGWAVKHFGKGAFV